MRLPTGGRRPEPAQPVEQRVAHEPTFLDGGGHGARVHLAGEEIEGAAGFRGPQAKDGVETGLPKPSASAARPALAWFAVMAARENSRSLRLSVKVTSVAV